MHSFKELPRRVDGHQQSLESTVAVKNQKNAGQFVQGKRI
jgi:hypothetical protein